MTSFVKVDTTVEHAGLDRASHAVHNVQAMANNAIGTRGIASVVLAAVFVTLFALSQKEGVQWHDGPLMAAWIALWAVAVVGVAAFMLPNSRSFRVAYSTWKESRARAAEDAQTWDVALQDARVMADISRAMTAQAAREMRKWY